MSARLKLFIASAMFPAAVFAQPVDVTTMTGQPLVYMKDGLVNGCGLRVIGGVPLPSSRFRMFDVSINAYAGGVALFKAVSYDMTHAEIHSTKRARREVVEAAWIKAPDEPGTRPEAPAQQSADEVALLYVTQFDAFVAVLKAQSQGRPISVGIRRRGESAERIYSGPVALTAEEHAQMAQCFSELSKR